MVTLSDVKWAPVDKDTKLAYRTSGRGPLNVLFMHGWGGSGAYFDEVLFSQFRWNTRHYLRSPGTRCIGQATGWLYPGSYCSG